MQSPPWFLINCTQPLGICSPLQEPSVLLCGPQEEKGPDTSKGKEKAGRDSVDGRDYPRSWLLLSLAKTFWRVLIESAAFKLLQDLLSFLSPQLLK